MAMRAGYALLAADPAEQWYFTDDDLANTPSQTGSEYTSPSEKLISAADEQTHRARSCAFIHKMVQKLEMHQFVASTACVLFHRFYMRQSMTKFHYYQIAGACVLLASKVEENKRSLKQIARVCMEVAGKGQTKDAAKDYDTWIRVLKKQEVVVLENCCFDLEIIHPYRFIDTLAPEFNIPVFVAKAATAHVNDCLRSTVCLRYRPEVVAVAALYLAISINGYGFQGSLFATRAVKLPAGSEREVELCAMDMLAFYQREAEVERMAQEHHRVQRPST
ncbi:hypothetical protein GGF46_002051 [Coemansia sp. RSA 552]|nr:hypothetical protein GGF46_002051 [Coemansia sp. RSA 552]